MGSMESTEAMRLEEARRAETMRLQEIEEAHLIVSLFTKTDFEKPKVVGKWTKRATSLTLNLMVPFSGMVYGILVTKEDDNKLAKYAKKCELHFKGVVDAICNQGSEKWHKANNWQEATNKLSRAFELCGGIESELRDQNKRAHCMLFYTIASAVVKCSQGAPAFSKLKRTDALEPGSEINLDIDKFLRKCLKCRSFRKIVSSSAAGEARGQATMFIIEEVVGDIIKDALTVIGSELLVNVFTSVC
jgi:hypothetical protein